jgi:translocator protein
MVRVLTLTVKVFVLTASLAVTAEAFQPVSLCGSHRSGRGVAARSPWKAVDESAPLPRTGRSRCELGSALSSTASDDSLTPLNAPKFDFDAILKYATAVGVQMSLLTLLFLGIDQVVALCSLKIPLALNCVLFYGLALKSRIFNPMSNARPQPRSLEVAAESSSNNAVAVANATPTMKRNMPSWTPPGVVFPIVWLLIIGPIRAVTSAMIYQSVGRYASLPILSLALHLSIGDVWNTVNNVERRYGASVLGVFCVWLSKAHAVYRYSMVNSVAGKLLGATLIWLTIASALVTATWRLNPDPATGRPEPLYPMTGKSRSKFAWFSSSAKP